MGKPTRDEQFSEYYISALLGAVRIDAPAHIVRQHRALGRLPGARTKTVGITLFALRAPAGDPEWHRRAPARSFSG